MIATAPFLQRHGSGVDSSNCNISTNPDKGEVARLERLLQEMTNNELPLVPWLDPFSVRRATQIKEKSRTSMKALTLSVRLPFFDLPVVYCEVAGDVTRKSGGYTVMDPEILCTENLVENKHMKLTRMRQRGRKGDEQLKPNPKYVWWHILRCHNIVCHSLYNALCCMRMILCDKGCVATIFVCQSLYNALYCMWINLCVEVLISYIYIYMSPPTCITLPLHTHLYAYLLL